MLSLFQAVLFFCSFDPIPGENQPVCTVKKHIEEDLSYDLKDSPLTVPVNCKCREDAERGRFAAYLDNGIPNHSMTECYEEKMQEVKLNPDARRAYMEMRDLLADARNEGSAETMTANIRSSYQTLLKKGYTSDEAKAFIKELLNVTDEDLKRADICQ